MLGETRDEKRFLWVVTLYPAFGLLALRLLYTHASQMYSTGDTQTGPSPSWWLLVLLYFLIDVLLVIVIMFIHRRLVLGHMPWPLFWDDASGIVALWFLFHLWLLCVDPVIAVRLEKVGLGKLEYLTFVAFGLSCASHIVKMLRTRRE